MIEKLFLAPFSFAGGNFADVLMQLEQMGFFSLVLPFLLVFAIVFGVLASSNIFKDNKAINMIISIAVGLMALQFGFVTSFFAEIFPRLGMWLAIILVLVILVGLFSKDGKFPLILVIGVIALAMIIILSQSFAGFSYDYRLASWFTDNLQWIIPIAVIVGLVGWAWSAQPPKTPTGMEFVNRLFKPFGT